MHWCSYSSMTERLDFVCLLSMTSEHVAHAGNPNAQNWWHFYVKRSGTVSRTSCLWKKRTRNTSSVRPFGKYYFSLIISVKLCLFFLWIRGQVSWNQSLLITGSTLPVIKCIFTYLVAQRHFCQGAFKFTPNSFVQAQIPPKAACRVNKIAHAVWFELVADCFYRWNTQKAQ